MGVWEDILQSKKTCWVVFLRVGLDILSHELSDVLRCYCFC